MVVSLKPTPIFLPFEATLFARVKAADSLIFLALLSDTYLETLKS